MKIQFCTILFFYLLLFTGGSLSYLEEMVFSALPTTAYSGESLISSIVNNKAESIHIDVLNDIGCGNIFSVIGIEDDFELRSDIHCQNYPTNILFPISRYPFKICYHDYEPYNLPPTDFKWNLEVFYKDESNNLGSIILVVVDAWEMTYPDFTYEMQVPNLPSFMNGNTWLRNIDGTLKAKLSVSASVGFHTEMDMKIIYPPSVPRTKITTDNCQSATIDFYSEGASCYIIHYSTIPGAPYENTLNVATGTRSHTFSRLSESDNYYFIVEAINDYGQSSWGNQVSKRC